MPAQILADTSGLCAATVATDAHHVGAESFYRGTSARLLVTDLVFAELMSLLTKRVGKWDAVRVGTLLKSSPRFILHAIEPEVEERAWRLFSQRYRDKDFDLIDCTCFAVMEGMGIREAFTFDRHFRQAGYRMVPGP